MSTLTDNEILDRLLYANLKDGEQVFVCDLCGAFAKDLALFKHNSKCPDKGRIK